MSVSCGMYFHGVPKRDFHGMSLYSTEYVVVASTFYEIDKQHVNTTNATKHYKQTLLDCDA